MWSCKPVVRSFGVKNGFFFKNDNLVVYSESEIRIYEVNQDQNQLLKSIPLNTYIHQVEAYLNDLVVLNDLGQLSIITPEYPYPHKVITVSDVHQIQSLSNGTLLLFSNKLTHMPSGMTYDYKKLGQFVQVESIQEHIYILYHAYDYHDEHYQYTVVGGLTNSVGFYRSFIHDITTNQTTNFGKNQLIIQMLPSNNYLFLLGHHSLIVYNAQQNMESTFEFEAQFMSKSNDKLLICDSHSIFLYEIEYESWGTISRVNYLQPIRVTPGIVSIRCQPAFNLFWIQTEIGACYLSHLVNKQPSQPTHALEPLPHKKIKILNEHSLKVISTFTTFKRVFGLAKANNLFILAGGATKQQLYCIQEGIPLIENAITKQLKQNLITIKKDRVSIIQETVFTGASNVKIHKLSQGVDLFQLQPSHFEWSLQGTLARILVYQKTYMFLTTDNNLQIVDSLTGNHHSIQVTHSIKHKGKYLFWIDHDHLQGGMIHDDTKQWSYIQCPPQRIRCFSLTESDSILYLAFVLENDQFTIFHYHDQFNQIFQKQLTKQFCPTCPTVELASLQNNAIVNCEIALIGKYSILAAIQYDNADVYIYRGVRGQTIQYFTFQTCLHSTRPIVIQQSLTNQVVIFELNCIIIESFGQFLIHFFQQDLSLKENYFLQLNKQYYIYSNDDSVYAIASTEFVPGNNTVVSAVAIPNVKLKQTILVSQFQDKYLIVVNRQQDVRISKLSKNEILIYRTDKINQVYAEFVDMENEEIIQVSTLIKPEGTFIIVLSAAYPSLPNQYSAGLTGETKVRILSLEYNSLKQVDQKIIKDTIPVDQSILGSQLLIALTDQLKYFDPIQKVSSILSLHLNYIQLTDIKQVQTLDFWIAVLDASSKVIVAKLVEEINEPKSEWVIEFGVNNRRIHDIQLFSSNHKILISVVDSSHNLHIYSVSHDKNKIKKVADTYFYQPTKIINHDSSLYISSATGWVYKVFYDDNSKEDYHQKLKELDSVPYTGGYSYLAKHSARCDNSKGILWI